MKILGLPCLERQVAHEWDRFWRRWDFFRTTSSDKEVDKRGKILMDLARAPLNRSFGCTLLSSIDVGVELLRMVVSAQSCFVLLCCNRHLSAARA